MESKVRPFFVVAQFQVLVLLKGPRVENNVEGIIGLVFTISLSIFIQADVGLCRVFKNHLRYHSQNEHVILEGTISKEKSFFKKAFLKGMLSFLGEMSMNFIKVSL